MCIKGIKHITHPFRRLQGKLTLSYVLTLVVTFLLVEVVVIGLFLVVASFNAAFFVENGLKAEAPLAAPYFADGKPDPAVLHAGLQMAYTNLANNLGPFKGSDHSVFIAVVDTQGRILSSAGTMTIATGTSIDAQINARNRADLRMVLRDRRGTTVTADVDAGNTVVAIAPIIEPDGRIPGVLVVKMLQPDKLQLLSEFLSLVVVTGVIITVIAAVAGLISGYLTARGLTTRLRSLSVAAERWSRGDFSALTQDTSEDELGQVGRRLNRMAEELQQLLEARQKLATLEERNRLARDLHDSVKQQIFAVVMQIAATKLLLRRDVDVAEQRLGEAEKLVKQAQQELTSLIRELRPVALEGKGLVVALRELIVQWSQQSNIVANLQVEGTFPVPLTVEEAFYRVAQEALSNVARHSQATLVQLHLTISESMIVLVIIDNGPQQSTSMASHTRQSLNEHGPTSNNFVPGVGMRSMQERMQALGGGLQITCILGTETRVEAQCPRSGRTTSDISTPVAL